MYKRQAIYACEIRPANGLEIKLENLEPPENIPPKPEDLKQQKIEKPTQEEEQERSPNIDELKPGLVLYSIKSGRPYIVIKCTYQTWDKKKKWTIEDLETGRRFTFNKETIKLILSPRPPKQEPENPEPATEPQEIPTYEAPRPAKLVDYLQEIEGTESPTPQFSDKEVWTPKNWKKEVRRYLKELIAKELPGVDIKIYIRDLRSYGHSRVVCGAKPLGERKVEYIITRRNITINKRFFEDAFKLDPEKATKGLKFVCGHEVGHQIVFREDETKFGTLAVIMRPNKRIDEEKADKIAERLTGITREEWNEIRDYLEELRITWRDCLEGEA